MEYKQIQEVYARPYILLNIVSKYPIVDGTLPTTCI